MPRVIGSSRKPIIPAQRIPHPELVTECNEDGTGWRIDAYGDWWPCTAPGPLLDPASWKEKKRLEAEKELANGPDPSVAAGSDPGDLRNRGDAGEASGIS